DFATPRLAFGVIPFTAAPAPDPNGDWGGWQALLSDDNPPAGGPPDAALRFRTPRGFATVSSALIALPAEPSPTRPAVFRFAQWQPEPAPWRDVVPGKLPGG